MDEINLNGIPNGNSSSDDEVVVGEDEELTEVKGSVSTTNGNSNENSVPSNDLGFFRFESPENEEDLFSDRPLPEWVGWGESSDIQVGGSSLNPFEDSTDSNPHNDVMSISSGESTLPNGTSTTSDSSSESTRAAATAPSLFEEDVEFVGVEVEGTEKAMEHALKEGIVGEAAPLKRNVVISPKGSEKEETGDGGAGLKEFNDANYWRIDKEVAVLE